LLVLISELDKEGSNVVEADPFIRFYCDNCGYKSTVSESYAGKKIRCPKCNNIIIIDTAYDSTLLDIQEQNMLKKLQADQHSSFEEAVEFGHKPEDQTEPADQRKLPWFIDMFFYPISTSCMVHLAILSFLPRMLLPLGHLSYWIYPPIFGLGFLVIFLGYLFYCLSDCIEDSANGGRRAPNIDVSPTVLLNAGELILPVLKVFVCTAVCLGPLWAYFIITRRTDLIFWLLVTYGVIFLPMVLLATVLFDSFRALNPILIIPSMFNVFLPYCGLVLLFFAVGGLVAIIMAIMPQSRLISYILSAVCIYLTMVMAHLLGRFCYKYKEKLNWEV
jgi:ribosomal protein S27E